MNLPTLTDARDVLPAEAVDAVVGVVSMELAVLGDSLRRAEREAETLESLVAEAAQSSEGDEAAIVRVSRFLDAAEDAATALRREDIDTARAETQARLDAVREEADLILLDSQPEPSGQRPALALLPADAVAEVPPIDVPAPPVGGTEQPTEQPTEQETEQETEQDAVVDPPAPAGVVDHLDLSGLPHLKAALEAMRRGGGELGSAQPEAIPVERLPTPLMAPVGTTPAPPTAWMPPDQDEPFRSPSEGKEPAPVEGTTWWSSFPMGVLLAMVAVVAVVALLLVLIG